jgi:hypothetical protein
MMKANNLSDAVKVLILVSAVIIACVLCAVGFKMVNEGKSAVNASTNNLSDMTSQYQDIDVAIYNGSNVQGSEVVSFINKTMSAEDYLAIIVKTKANTAGLSYNYSYVAASQTLASLSTSIAVTDDMGNDNYINPSAMFSGKVYKDLNGIIIAVEFTQL